MKKPVPVLILILVAVVALCAFVFFSGQRRTVTAVNSFEECAAAGFSIMESYPRQCRAEDKTFTEEINPQPSPSDLIRIDAPLPGATVQSPLVVSGEARGTWYFEASFPIKLFDGNGKEIVATHADALSDWMTTDLVPFKATLVFGAPATASGILVLEKDNPSGLPQNAAEVKLSVRFVSAGSGALNSGITGNVVLGPTCPVERIPPDPNCAPRPYPTKIDISKSGAGGVYKTVSTDANAAFQILLEAGNYVLKPQSFGIYPRCGEEAVMISPYQFTDITLQCDTGIR